MNYIFFPIFKIFDGSHIWLVWLTWLAWLAWLAGSQIVITPSEVWGIDCNGQLEKDPAELVQNKFLKWLLGVNKYCNNKLCVQDWDRKVSNENWSPM